MVATDPPDVDKVEAIKEIEHSCDRTTRGIIDRLNRTFVTPLDREDIHALAGSLDDVMDAIDAVGTTHTITGAIIGVGAVKRLTAVRWGVARQIVWVWILTIPASAIVAALTYRALALFGYR